MAHDENSLRHTNMVYVTKKDLAKKFEVSTRTIDDWMRKGRLPFIKVSPKVVRFPLELVEKTVQTRFLVNPK